MRVDAMPGLARIGVMIILLSTTLTLAFAQTGGEAAPAAANPELEAQVRALSYKLRCLVCQNESVAESRAPLAVDLRNQVREQLAAGKTEAEVVDFMVTRYGDFVLYRPPFKASTALLWLGPGILLFSAAGWLILRLRRRSKETPVSHLTDEERARARAMLDGDTQQSEEPRS